MPLLPNSAFRTTPYLAPQRRDSLWYPRARNIHQLDAELRAEETIYAASMLQIRTSARHFTPIGISKPYNELDEEDEEEDDDDDDEEWEGEGEVVEEGMEEEDDDDAEEEERHTVQSSLYPNPITLQDLEVELLAGQHQSSSSVSTSLYETLIQHNLPVEQGGINVYNESGESAGQPRFVVNESLEYNEDGADMDEDNDDDDDDEDDVEDYILNIGQLSGGVTSSGNGDGDGDDPHAEEGDDDSEADPHRHRYRL